ncbi:MAG: hypothetical protein MI924_33270 [Chloroflexales bacterium]|nr:hypothetical protein [Chloroflexales bacterium]
MLNDLGITLEKVPDTFAEVSIERLPEWDADVLFVLVWSDDQGELLGSPLLLQLNAARQGQVHAVPLFAWGSMSILALTDVLNDLETYLLDQEIDTSWKSAE